MRTFLLASCVGSILAIGLLASTIVEAASNTQVAATSVQKIDVTIKTLCTLKGTQINILNNGPKWPDRAKLKIMFADDKSVISARKMKLGQGHSASFRIKTKIADGRPLGVYVEPTWYDREFKFDGTQKCS